MRRLPVFLGLLAALLAGCATPPEHGSVVVRLLAINDLHGHLRPPPGGIRLRDPQDAAKTVDVAAGGVEHLASALREARAQNPNHVFVAAGDLVGASPLLSALFHDEPTVELLGQLGLAVSAVGNHEFDRGAAELLRLQNGGCHPSTGCQGPAPFTGARFQYLAASTIDSATGRTLLPAYTVRRFDGIPVAFIGLTLKDTPRIVRPSGVAGLEFRDEATTVNALVPGLRAQGIEAIVVLIHEGGQPAGGPDECPALSGAIVPIVKALDRAVDVVISGHTHRAYNCRVDGRLVTSADKFGTVLSEIDLVLDRASGDVREARAHNVIVRNDRFAKDAAIGEMIAAWERLAAPLAQRVVGRLAAPLSREPNEAGESTLGQVVADAQLAASTEAGAQIALTNPGGLRTGLAGAADGSVRYEDLFAAQPFSNQLVTLTLTGAQLQQVLEQQWLGQARPRLLQVSRGFAYTWDAAQPTGQRVVAGSLRLNGATIAPEQRLRVTVNDYLASGGDNFSAFRENGIDAQTGVMDVDALERFFRHNDKVTPGALDRIRRVN
ncbi:MAG: bifunctional metallophosphatase/5'-nucleotidase [Piscinibacter sp.]